MTFLHHSKYATARRDLITFLLSAKIMVLPPSRAVTSRCPLDICIYMGSSPLPSPTKKKKDIHSDVLFLLVGEAGLEPARPQ